MDTYICRDCGGEHDEPLEANLGHFALCFTCAVERDGETPLPRTIEIVAELTVYRPAA